MEHDHEDEEGQRQPADDADEAQILLEGRLEAATGGKVPRQRVLLEDGDQQPGNHLGGPVYPLPEALRRVAKTRRGRGGEKFIILKFFKILKCIKPNNSIIYVASGRP